MARKAGVRSHQTPLARRCHCTWDASTSRRAPATTLPWRLVQQFRKELPTGVSLALRQNVLHTLSTMLASIFASIACGSGQDCICQERIITCEQDLSVFDATSQSHIYANHYPTATASPRIRARVPWRSVKWHHVAIFYSARMPWRSVKQYHVAIF